VAEFSLALCIESPEILLAELEAKLGVPLVEHGPDWYWFEMEPAPGASLSDRVQAMVERIGIDTLDWLREHARECYVHTGVFYTERVGALTLDPAFLADLAALGLHVSMRLYPCLNHRTTVSA